MLRCLFSLPLSSMADLPPFSGRTSRCPKCATLMAPSVRFMDGGSLWLPADSGTQWLRPGHDFMLRECAVCRFQWIELCADHPTG